MIKQAHSVPELKIEGLEKLSAHDQDRVKIEARALAEALAEENQSKLAIGEHLSNLRGVLKRRFLKFLKDNFKMSQATAYRYIDLYGVAKSKMPKPVLEMAVRQGVRIHPEALKRNPPPKTGDTSKIQEYLDKLRPTRIEVHKSTDILLKECVNFCYLRYQQVPNKQKPNFQRSLLGMLMTKFGIASDQMYSPVAVPSSFIVHRGRPKAA